MSFNYSSTQIGSGRTRAGEFMLQFIKSDFEWIQSEIIKAIEKVDLFEEKVKAFILKRLESIKALDGIEKLFEKVQKPAQAQAKAKASKRKISDMFVSEKAEAKRIKVENVYQGQATCKYHSEMDPWGFSITLRKSDFQKAIRMGKISQALVSFFACYNIGVLFQDESNAKRVQTNILNRLIICSMEDIGVANPSLVFEILDRIGPMIKNRSKRDPALIGKIIVKMCKSKKPAFNP